MRYLLKRDDGAYVADIALTGGSSYTFDLRKAKRYPTYATAEHDRCPGNEHVTTADEEVGGGIQQ